MTNPAVNTYYCFQFLIFQFPRKLKWCILRRDKKRQTKSCGFLEDDTVISFSNMVVLSKAQNSYIGDMDKIRYIYKSSIYSRCIIFIAVSSKPATNHVILWEAYNLRVIITDMYDLRDQDEQPICVYLRLHKPSCHPRLLSQIPINSWQRSPLPRWDNTF